MNPPPPPPWCSVLWNLSKWTPPISRQLCMVPRVSANGMFKDTKHHRGKGTKIQMPYPFIYCHIKWHPFRAELPCTAHYREYSSPSPFWVHHIIVDVSSIKPMICFFAAEFTNATRDARKVQVRAHEMAPLSGRASLYSPL